MTAASHQLLERYRKVCDQVDGLIELAADHGLHGLSAPRVSKWTAGKQLEHLMLSDQTILDSLDRLIDGREGPAPGGPSFMGRLLLALGFIPRGLGKSPEPVVPAGRDPADLEAGLRRLRQRLDELLEQLPVLEEAGWRVRHPAFGALAVGEWMRFIDTHHRHHQKIIRDIRRAAGKRP